MPSSLSTSYDGFGDLLGLASTLFSPPGGAAAQGTGDKGGSSGGKTPQQQQQSGSGGQTGSGPSRHPACDAMGGLPWAGGLLKMGCIALADLAEPPESRARAEKDRFDATYVPEEQTEVCNFGDMECAARLRARGAPRVTTKTARALQGTGGQSPNAAAQRSQRAAPDLSGGMGGGYGQQQQQYSPRELELLLQLERARAADGGSAGGRRGRRGRARRRRRR